MSDYQSQRRGTPTARHVLIVDDNLTNRTMLAGSLSKVGYHITEAENGTSAVAIAKEELPDVVLLDVSMPGMDGFAVCEVLKAEPNTASIPVIFLTAISDPESIQKAFEMGGADYITKPFHMGEVKARVSVHLQLRDAIDELEETNCQLLRAQKLESIGQLAAGIAHEINTPTQFVGHNTRFLQKAFRDLTPVLDKATQISQLIHAGQGVPSELAEELEQAIEAADIEFLSEEIPSAIEQSLDGIDRVSKIVRAMKEFSHPGVTEMTNINVNDAISSTATVGVSEWKYVASLETDFDVDMPPVPCLPGEFNQVILNMIVNAAHAIADVVGQDGERKGTITISTRCEGDFAVIRVADTGSGIPVEVREKIFDPFFTTKGVGRGTGQGLSIAHAVIVQKHGGTLEFETECDKGTTFIIRLPLRQATSGAAA